jgi:ATP-dependent 26S proteasome regulatory subunit
LLTTQPLFRLRCHTTLLSLQEEYVKEEQKNLKRELLRAQEEVKRIQSVPLVIGQFLEMVNATSGIVGSTTGQYDQQSQQQDQHQRTAFRPRAGSRGGRVKPYRCSRA